MSFILSKENMVVKKKKVKILRKKTYRKKIQENHFFHNQNKIGLQCQVFGDYDIGKNS